MDTTLFELTLVYDWDKMATSASVYRRILAAEDSTHYGDHSKSLTLSPLCTMAI